MRINLIGMRAVKTRICFLNSTGINEIGYVIMLWASVFGENRMHGGYDWMKHTLEGFLVEKDQTFVKSIQVSSD